ETITDANFVVLDKDNNTYNWTEKKLGTDGKIQTIPHSETVENGCEWQRDQIKIRTGVTFLVSSIPMSANDTSKGSFNILDDADFSVCKGKDWRNKDVWKGSFSNIKIPIFCSLCQKPVWQVNYGKEKKYDMECIDIISGSREEFTNILNSINSLVFLPNKDDIYNYKCDWIRKIYNTLTALQSGNENINFEAPVFSSLGTMVHETNHLIKMKKLVTNALNIFDVDLATLKYEAGQCPDDIKDKLKNEILESLRYVLNRVTNLYNEDGSNTKEVEKESNVAEGGIYEILINELRKFNKSKGCPDL
ncbi:MAG: hypothetical protein GXX85_13650, partial [Ignavibacteria bacterium]|nr:hypothetical protein [Ignavibacteria bacterium]